MGRIGFQTRRRHGKCSDAKTKKKKSAKQNTQMKVKNKFSIKTTCKKVEKSATVLKPTKAEEVEVNPIDYLNNAVQKSLHNIPLTHSELKQLFDKFKRDGHYKIDPNLPQFTSLLDNPQQDTSVPNQTPKQPKTVNYKTSSEYSTCDSPYRYQYPFTENPTELQVYNDLKENDIDTCTFVQQNTPDNESYNSSFSNTYIMNYNNNVNMPNTLHDTAGIQSSDSFGQFYSDNENPYDLSYRTSCSSMSDSNITCTMSSFGKESFQDNTLQSLENTAKNNLIDCNSLRNHNFVDSHIPPINPPFFDNNNDCLNVHNNNVSLTMNKDNGFVDKICNVITQIWDNKQLTQVFPGGNIDSYSYRKQNTNDQLCQFQGTTFMESHLKQYGVSTDMNNMSHLPQAKNHVYHPYKNVADINNNFSSVPLENTLCAPTFMTAPALAPNLLYDMNSF